MLQEKLELLNTLLAIPQLSVELLSTWLRFKVPELPDRTTVAFVLQLATGGVLSITTTLEEQVELLLEASLTVSVIGLLWPMFEQLKVQLAGEKFKVTHTSDEPLFTADGKSVAELFTSVTVTVVLQIAVGAILSTTVTLEEQVEVPPFAEVTVSTTVLLGPRLAQVN